MPNAGTGGTRGRVLRWIARVWTIPIFGLTLLFVATPDPTITEPVPLADWFLLSLWGMAVIGLLIAWRWEAIGAVVTIAAMILREVAWLLLRGRWIVSFLIVWAVILPPAVLFLAASSTEASSATHAGSHG